MKIIFIFQDGARYDKYWSKGVPQKGDTVIFGKMIKRNLSSANVKDYEGIKWQVAENPSWRIASDWSEEDDSEVTVILK